MPLRLDFVFRRSTSIVAFPTLRYHGIKRTLRLENLTFPLALVAAAMRDPKTEVSLLGIEDQDGRSIYRIRTHGQLGLGGLKTGPDLPVIKDLLVDALTFNILRVEDRPFQTPTYKKDGKLVDKPSRVIDFGDFRTVNGLLVPFSITTELLGQKTMTIQLSSVSFNSSLGDQDFQN